MSVPLFILLAMRKPSGLTFSAAMQQGAESVVDYDTSSETQRRTKRCAGANLPIRLSAALFLFGCNELMPDSGSLCAQWKRIALELDALLGLNQWKQSAPNAYYDAPLVRRVLKALREFRSREIPCDVLYLDIDYMDGYRVFTWDRERFPDPAGLIAELGSQGFRVVTITDPGVKVDEDYDVYVEAPERLFGLSPLTDQKLAGVVMMVEQALTLGAAIVVLVLAARRGRQPRRGSVEPAEI